MDERVNKDDLKFYWKGDSYDDPFNFQDRLQFLYKEGMRQFLDEDITYIDNNNIDSIFEHYDLENIKKSIKDVFKRQKFFTNNDFAFIDVHNEKLFHQNFKVLKKIVKMIQDISLTRTGENQFLGDLFEGFLDQGIKQNEGQFFTPLPIVKFIISSIPHRDNIKVIDYACGSGHFLNEYAKINPKSEVIGVEKEYRLSKVAKVSSFMYGNDVEVVHADALSQNDKLKNNDFDLLIANPPFSVKGFLETLNDEDRKKYYLIKEIDEKSFSSNNSIECFFIERAKQLLNKSGYAGIIVPSSMLNKSNPSAYVKTREIILKHFDIISIVELGNGTFGKTGTSTVILFLNRRCDKEDLSGNFKELAQKVYGNNLEVADAFNDKDLLRRYCLHIECDYEVYKTLFTDKINDKLFEYDIFKEYKTNFEKSPDSKNRKNKTNYKNKNKEERDKIEQQELIKYVKSTEEKKFYYFCLASKQTNDVVIVRSPSNTDARKKFLGYEWSGAKGNEGIQYIAGSNVEVNDNNKDLEDEDKRIIENIKSLDNIQTPLYNPKNIDDNKKINSIILNNFNNIASEIPDELSEYVNKVRLVDMLDFDMTSFNKAISLNPKKKDPIKSKWELVRLGDVCDIENGGTPSTKIAAYWNGNIPWATLIDTKEKYLTSTQRKITQLGLANSNARLLPINTVIFSSRATIGEVTIAKVKTATNQGYKNFICNDKKIKYEFLYEILKKYNKDIALLGNGTTYNEISKKDISNFKIPLPPIEIQNKIVEEIKNVEDKESAAQEKVESIEKQMHHLSQKTQGYRTKLVDISLMITRGKSPKYGSSNIQVIKSGQVRGVHSFDFSKRHYVVPDFKLDDRKLQVGDILINSTGVGTAGRVNLFSLYGDFVVDSHITIVRLDKSKALPKFVLYQLWHFGFQNIETMATGSSGQIELAKSTIENLQIPLPTIEEQTGIVGQIEELELKIKEAKVVLENAQSEKEKILNKYLL